MDPLLLLQLSAGFAVVPPRVHREQPAQRYVPINAYWIEVRVARHFGLGCQGGQEIASQQQRPTADTSVAASPGSLKASSKSHNERLNPHPNTNSGPLKMKGVCTHIPTHTHTNVLEVSRGVSSEHGRLQKPLLMVSSSLANWLILIMQPCSLYLALFLLSALCSPSLPAPESGGYMQQLNSETGVRGERSLKAGTKVWSFDSLPCLYGTTRVRSALLPVGSWSRQEVTSGPTGFSSRLLRNREGKC